MICSRVLLRLKKGSIILVHGTLIYGIILYKSDLLYLLQNPGHEDVYFRNQSWWQLSHFLPNGWNHFNFQPLLRPIVDGVEDNTDWGDETAENEQVLKFLDMTPARDCSDLLRTLHTPYPTPATRPSLHSEEDYEENLNEQNNYKWTWKQAQTQHIFCII